MRSSEDRRYREERTGPRFPSPRRWGLWRPSGDPLRSRGGHGPVPILDRGALATGMGVLLRDCPLGTRYPMACRSILQRRKLPVTDPGDRKRRRGLRAARPSSRSIAPRRVGRASPLGASAWPAPRAATASETSQAWMRGRWIGCRFACAPIGSVAPTPCGSVAADPAYPVALPAARDAGLNPKAGGAAPSSEIGPRELGIVLNELSPRFYVGTHQIGEEAIGLVGIVDGDL